MAADQRGVIDDDHRRIIAVIQPVLKQYRFALAGGNALRVHGLSTRETRDVNMHTSAPPQEVQIGRVAPLVETALLAAGFGVQRVPVPGSGIFPDADDYQARWNVTVSSADQPEAFLENPAASERRILLQLFVDELLSPPVDIPDLGLVLRVEDALAGKVAALATRADARDFIDVAEAMRRGWSPDDLIGLAMQQNPDYDRPYFTQVRANLAALDDFEFTQQYGLSLKQVRELRELFEQWPAAAG